MGLFWRKPSAEEKRTYVERNIDALTEVWAEEIALLGEQEFQRRRECVSNHQLLSFGRRLLDSVREMPDMAY